MTCASWSARSSDCRANACNCVQIRDEAARAADRRKTRIVEYRLQPTLCPRFALPSPRRRAARRPRASTRSLARRAGSSMSCWRSPSPSLIVFDRHRLLLRHVLADDRRAHARRVAAHRSAHLRAAVRRPARPAAHAGADDRSAQRSRLCAPRPRVEQPGEFAIGRDALAVVPRDGDRQGQTRAASPFAAPARRRRARRARPTIERCPHRKQALDERRARRAAHHRARPRGAREAARRAARRDPAAHGPGGDRDRGSPLLRSPRHRSHRHDARGRSPTSSAARSTCAAAARSRSSSCSNTFLSAMLGHRARRSEKTPQRKFTEWLMSIALERRLSKDQILELYLNDVSLGQRGSFAIHGVPEAARLFFGKDVSNLSLTEAATIAGVIQSPSRLLAVQQPRARRRSAATSCCTPMAETGFISADAAERASHEPLQIVAARARAEAPYFVDYVTPGAAGAHQGGRRRSTSTRRSTCTCSASRRTPSATGSTRVDELLAQAQAAAGRRRR